MTRPSAVGAHKQTTTHTDVIGATQHTPAVERGRDIDPPVCVDVDVADASDPKTGHAM